jgi:cellulose synthase/poly-beta-1,6-N-acetylglucosamine synthase-like glycosyltransferase
MENEGYNSMNKTITVIIPALNEEANIRATYDEVMDALQGCFEDYEIIIFNDGSVDRTGAIIDDLAKQLNLGDKVVNVFPELGNMDGREFGFQEGADDLDPGAGPPRRFS